MRFDYNKYFGEEMVLSDVEIKLIKSKTKELRKICYGFGFFRFDVLSCYIGHDKKEDELVKFTYEQIIDSLREVLPFVEKYRERLIEDEWVDRLLNKIEGYMEDISVSVLDSPLSAEDICTEMNDAFDCYNVAYAFAKFCGRATVCKVYDYLKKQEHDEKEIRKSDKQ